MNCEELNRVALWLEAGAPETLGENLPRMGHAMKIANFDMRHWTEDTDCGTVCCIGGFISATTKEGGFFNEANVALGLDSLTAHNLFHPPSLRGWHATPYQAARVVRHLMATGEVDWSRKVMGPREEKGFFGRLIDKLKGK